MTEKNEMDEEELAEEAERRKTQKYLKVLVKIYKQLFGDDPGELSILEIQNKIREEMQTKNLNPYKL